MTDFLCDNISENEKNHLTFAGFDTCDLAAKFGTPLYLLDEEKIRSHCREYRRAFAESFPAGARPLYASKANAQKAIYRIMREEKMGIDVVSSGEIYTARASGFDLSDAFFHGNSKTDADIAFAMDCGVGYFVADNEEEILALEREAASRNILQKLLIRVSPGIDPHTYAAVNTGCVDSKFGVAIETGQAASLTELALSQKHLSLVGFHCHIGSQVFAEDVFERGTAVMLGFLAEMRDRFGFVASMLDLGGGFGVPYLLTDPKPDIRKKIASIASVFHTECKRLNFPEPQFLMEPGRSIVADAGMTLYTVQTKKVIPGYKTYVSVDGGMADNPRFALYGSPYTVLSAGKIGEKTDLLCSVVGRCCESGDILQEKVSLPASTARGDILAFCTSGAYQFSMASNYNKLPRPATVLLTQNGEAMTVSARQTPEDLIAGEV